MLHQVVDVLWKSISSRRELLKAVGLSLLASLAAPFRGHAAQNSVPEADPGHDGRPRLPKDGSWVKYHWSLTSVLPPDDRRHERTGTLTFKIVGTETVEQKTHRWVEGAFVYNEDGTIPHPVIVKALVNAAQMEALFAGKQRELQPQPQRPTKFWIKIEDNPPKRLEETRGPNDFPCLARLMQEVGGDLPPADLRGEIKDSREDIEPRTVEFQKGRLDCQGFRTRAIQESPDGKYQTHTTRSVWESSVVSFFGFAECHIDRKQLVDDQVEIIQKVQLLLADFGDDAKTALPDQK